MKEEVNGVHKKHKLERRESGGRRRENKFLMSTDHVLGTVLGPGHTMQ